MIRSIMECTEGEKDTRRWVELCWLFTVSFTKCWKTWTKYDVWRFWLIV